MSDEQKSMCSILGHDVEGQPVRPVGSSMGRKTTDEHGNPLPGPPVAYHMRECKRCKRRQPLTPEDAELQREINDGINRVMNAARKQYGYGWLDFSDGP